MKKNRYNLLTGVLVSLLLTGWSSFLWVQDHYLLSKQVENIIQKGEYRVFLEICLEEISVNCESPLELKGYYHIDKLIHDFDEKFSGFKVEQIEWASKELGERFAVESLNLILKNKRSDKIVYYKIIFFLKKVEQEWKIHYLKGLKI